MVIGKIREKSTLLLIMIGGAMLAFILGDLFSSSNFLVSGSQTEIGEVAGEAIEGRDFEARVQQAIENYKAQSGETSVSAATTDQLREQTWTQLLRDIVMNREMEALGVMVTADEIYDMVQGANPHPQVIQAFTDPNTGRFDRAQVAAFLQRMEEDPEMKGRWVRFERDIAKFRRSEKYFNLIKKGLYTTTLEAKNDFEAKNAPATVSMVVKRYTEVEDTTITVSDSDIKKYYDKHIKKYEQEASRDVDYVAFPVEPSKEDIDKVRQWAEQVKVEFQAAENDTLFVNRESDVRFNARWTEKGSLPLAIDSIMFAADKGYVHGPYREGRIFRLAKLIGVKMSPDSVKARHILLTPETYGARTKTVADSIYGLVKDGKGDFAAIARSVSEDPGSGKEGGDLGWFTEGQMVPTFNDACFDGKKGDFALVQSQFGFHIIEVLDQKGKSEKRAVAIIQRTVEPSSKTYQMVYGQADDFARGVSSVESFDDLVAEQGLNKKIAPNLKANDRTIAGLDSPREIIRWAFQDADKGDVSKVFEIGNTFVVAVLTAVREKGHTDISEIREELEAEVRKEKKAEQFISEFNAVGAADIQALADAMNLAVEVKERIQFSSSAIPGLGREPEVIGTVSVLEAGKMSAPIKGQQGVFVLRVDNRAEAPATSNYAASVKTLNSGLASRVDYEVFEALKKKADVEDNRARFY